MRSREDILKWIEELKRQRVPLRADRMRAARNNDQEAFEAYAIAMYRNAVAIQALQWVLEGAGE